MSHYPGHLRRAFLEWIWEGFPETATIEENYQPQRIPADQLLRTFIYPDGCTDVMPKDACEAVAGHIGYLEDTSGMTYAVAAAALVVLRAAGADAAEKFLARLHGAEEVVR